MKLVLAFGVTDFSPRIKGSIIIILIIIIITLSSPSHSEEAAAASTADLPWDAGLGHGQHHPYTFTDRITDNSRPTADKPTVTTVVIPEEKDKAVGCEAKRRRRSTDHAVYYYYYYYYYNCLLMKVPIFD